MDVRASEWKSRREMIEGCSHCSLRRGERRQHGCRRCNEHQAHPACNTPHPARHPHGLIPDQRFPIASSQRYALLFPPEPLAGSSNRRDALRRRSSRDINCKGSDLATGRSTFALPDLLNATRPTKRDRVKPITAFRLKVDFVAICAHRSHLAKNRWNVRLSSIF